MRGPWNSAPAIAMRCDHPGCLAEVRRAPRICVPHRGGVEPGCTPIRIMTTLHYCERHRAEFQAAAYWTPALMAKVEACARAKRPALFRPDFDRAWVELVLVTTPEYRAFLADIGACDAAA